MDQPDSKHFYAIRITALAMLFFITPFFWTGLLAIGALAFTDVTSGTLFSPSGQGGYFLCFLVGSWMTTIVVFIKGKHVLCERAGRIWEDGDAAKKTDQGAGDKGQGSGGVQGKGGEEPRPPTDYPEA